jgi:chromosome segregation protein
MTPRLKSLELHGYKTFASNTIFEFPGNITAIVGPNGSGKSNISDAIRWVLGEQAFSLLRGKKTEDMIFTGSELRPRSSMATASIIFNNEDNWLPIDFSEVSIARRAYRNGENEYLLNNQKVRLKEINELLAQTGLAERTYTVIGQGLVDAALSLKPDERRKFFEEAAGIDLYRSRREEAFNRLEATKRNMERAYDILSELTPRMRLLERQAKRVEEYDRVRSELRLLIRDWYGYQWHNAQKELGRTKGILKIHESQLNQVRSILDESEKKFSSFREQINITRHNLDQWHEELATLHREREQLSKQLAVFDERLAGLKEKNQEQEVQLGVTEEEIGSHQKEINDLLQEKNKIEIRYKESEKQSHEVRVQLQERLKFHDEISAKVSEKQSESLKFESQRMTLNARLIELDNRVRSAKQEMESRKGTQNRFEVEEKEANEQLDSLQSLKIKKTEEFTKINANFNEQKTRLSEIELEFDKCRESLFIAQAESARYSEQLKMLDDAEDNLIGGSSGSKELLEAVKKGFLSSELELLTKQLVVPKEYEKSVVAVLSEYIDALVYSKEEDLDDILNFIETSKIAKTVLIQKNSKRIENLAEGVKGAGYLGVLIDFVQSADQKDGMIHHLLGKYLLVKDRKAAQRIIKNSDGKHDCVTLSGELFTRDGIVIAGQGESDSRISLPRVRKETKQLWENAEGKRKQNQDRLQILEIERSNSRKLLDGLLQDLNEDRIQIDQLRTKLDQNSLRKAQIKQQQNWLSQQLSDDLKKIENSQVEITQIGKDLQTLNHNLDQSKKDLANLSIEKEAMPLQEFQSKTIDFDTQKAIFTQAIKNLEVRMSEKQRIITGNETRIQDLKARIKETQQEITEISDNRKKLIESELEIRGSIDELRKKVDPAELELITKEKEFQIDLVKQESHRQAVTTAERLVAQSQFEFARQTGHIENLRERIEDDFGLVAFEYASNVSGPTPLPFEGLVEELPVKDELPIDLEDNISQLRTHLRRMGPINQEAEHEYRSAKERHEFLTLQTDDLTKADADLRQVIANLDELMKKEFKKTFEAVAVQFHEIFGQLFRGGNARLIMTEGETPSETGVDIEARLPGQREQGLSLLSGGERSLIAVALIFALLRVSPTPFCVLDEVDAMLDESNVGRFCEMLIELSKNTQFIIITHNRNTVQVADVIYGVTMGKDSSSQVISLQMDELSEEMVK